MGRFFDKIFNALMHNPGKIIVFAALVGLMLTVTPALAETIYSESFSGGSHQKSLHGSSPDAGANTWVASKAWKANGTIAEGSDADDDRIQKGSVQFIMFYLEVAPQLYLDVIQWLGRAGSNTQGRATT